MVHNAFNTYDRIIVVNLPERVDRRRQMIAELQGKVSAYEFFPAICPRDAGAFRSRGSHGAFLSHLTLLERAASREESILILQDDCQFISSVYDTEIREETQIFYGGYVATSYPAAPHISDIEQAHCMGFSAEICPPLAAYLQQIYTGGQSRLPPIDGAIVNFRRSTPVRAQFSLISRQRSSRSDITPSRLDEISALRPLLPPVRYIKNLIMGRA